jgi:hypothetical protein
MARLTPWPAKAARIAGLVVLAGVPVRGYENLYATPASRLPLAAAVVAGLVAASPLAAGWPARIRWAVSGAALLGCAVCAWLLTAPGPATDPAELLSVTTAFLTFHQPMDATSATLALPFVVTAVATWLSAVLLAAPAPAVSLVPPVCAFSTQLLLCAGVGPGALGAAGFAVAAAVVVLFGRPRHGWQAAVARPVVVLAAVGAVAVGAGLATTGGAGDRFDPRDRWNAADPVLPQVTPLGLLRAELTGPDPQRFTVRLSGPGADRVELIRVAVLDRYDGVSWTADADFRTSGAVLRAGAAGPRVSAEILVDRLPGRFLPSLAEPVSMPARPGGDGARTIGFDPRVGLVARENPAGWRYTVQSPATPTESAVPPVTGEDVALLDTGAADQAVASAVAQLTSARARLLPPGPADDAGLAALARTMRTEFPYSPDAPAGHSLGAVTRILAGTGPENGGFAEQRASAFALLARAADRPARVVTGYRLPEPGGDGVVRVSAADAHAWSEVWIGGRWRTYDPTDVEVPPTPFPGAAFAAAAARPTPDPRPNPPRPPKPPEPPPGPDPWWPTVASWALAVLLVIAVLLVVVAAAAWVVAVRRRRAEERRLLREREAAESRRVALRARRMSEGPPAQRVLGAWAETLDHLRRDGMLVPGAAGPRNVVRAAEEAALPQTGPLAELALLVDRALFGAGRPTEDDARQAWRREARVTAPVTPSPDAGHHDPEQESR